MEPSERLLSMWILKAYDPLLAYVTGSNVRTHPTNMALLQR